jgi:hypothetical protein
MRDWFSRRHTSPNELQHSITAFVTCKWYADGIEGFHRAKLVGEDLSLAAFDELQNHLQLSVDPTRQDRSLRI